MSSERINTKAVHRQSPNREAGATLAGYSLTVAMFIVVSLGALGALTNNSEAFLEESSETIGARRDSANDLTDGASEATPITTPSTAPPPTTPADTSVLDLTGLGPSTPVENAGAHLATTYTSGGNTYDGLGFGNGGPIAENCCYNNVPTDPDASFTLSFEVTEATDYQIIGTVFSPTGSDDSFWVQVFEADGTTQVGVDQKWRMPSFNPPAEDNVHNGDGGSGAYTVFPLTAGTYKVKISVREPGTFLTALRLDPFPWDT